MLNSNFMVTELKIVNQSHVIFCSLAFLNMMIFKSTIHLPRALHLVIFVALLVSQLSCFAVVSTEPRASVH